MVRQFSLTYSALNDVLLDISVGKELLVNKRYVYTSFWLVFGREPENMHSRT
jgi:hypothetical protein